MRPAVCLLTDEYPPSQGGVGQSVARIAQTLAKHYAVTVLVLERTYNPSPFESVPDGSVEVLYCYPTEDIPDQRHARDMERFQRLVRLARQKEFQLFHSFFPMTTGMYAGLLAGVSKKPLIASFRGNDFHHGIFSRHMQTILWLCERAELVTFVNSGMAELASVLCGNVSSGSRVIHNGVVLPAETTARAPFHTPPVLGSSGAFRAKKGVRTLIEGCSVLAKEMDFRLLLVGDFISEERDHWRKLLDHSGLAERTEITGFVPHDDIRDWLNKMDVFLYPSLYDGCPNSVLEAASVGLPIICSRTPALEDLLTDDVSCLMHESEDPRDLARCSKQLLADDVGQNRAKQLGEEARRVCRERFSLEQEAATWQDIYESFLA